MTVAIGAPGPASSPRLLRTQWLRATVLGELWGFAPPAFLGAALVAIGAPDIVLILGLSLAGTIEGVVIGRFQAAVLRHWIPPVRDWAKVTAFSAGLAWFAGMGGSQLVQSLGSKGLIVAGPGWVIGLCCMGLLQARQLRLAAGRSAAWFPITTIAWLIGVTIPVLALSIIPSGWSLVAHGVVAISAAVLMGATVGAITSLPLVNLVLGGGLSTDSNLSLTKEL